MKKTLALILAVILAVSVFSGCKKNEASTSTLYDPSVPVKDAGGLELPLCEDDTEITWSVDANYDGLNESYVVQKMRAMTGVNVQLLVFPTSAAGEKIKVLAAAKDLPDIVGQGLEPEFGDGLAVQGAFAAVEDYVDVLPNFKRTFVENEENNWIFKTHAASDGKLYPFFGWDWNRDINHSMLYRKDIFDKHNIPMWNSPETFYDALKKLKEAYPDSYPLTSKVGDAIFERYSLMYGMKANYPYYNEEKGEWLFTDIQPEYKEMLDFFRKLYDEKLLDPEFITNTEASWTSKMTQKGESFVTFDWIGRMSQFNEQAGAVFPGYDLRFANPVGPKQVYPEASQLCWGRYVSKNEKSELAFKLLDFCISPTGKELISMGIEGETYVLDENGMADMFELEDDATTNSLIEKYGMNIQGMYLSFDRRSKHFNFTEHEQEAQDYMKDEAHVSPCDPELPFTPEQKALVQSKISDLQKAAREFATKYILTNETGDAAWNAWVEKAKSLGCDEITDIYNEAQKKLD